jgi:hypothetical protein
MNYSMGGEAVSLSPTIAFDAKALPNHPRQVSWLITSWPTPSQGLRPQWHVIGPSLVNYSCATAHDFHVIPSWRPHYRADLSDLLLF